jgi:hypothetical protein
VGNEGRVRVGAARAGSKVEDREVDMFDLSPDTVGMFDVVLFSACCTT